MPTLSGTPLHADYTTFSELLAADNTPPASYKEARDNYIARKENIVLFTSTKTGSTEQGNQDVSFIHNDSAGIPTLGYGVNLKVLTYAQIDEAIHYAFQGSLNADQLAGLSILQDWKNGHYTDAALIDMAQGRSGTFAQISALQSLAMTASSATHLLDGMLDGGVSFKNYEATLSAQLGAADVPQSTERLALLDTLYTGVFGGGLKGAAQHNDPTSRAESWVQIKYINANWDNVGIESRRTEEADQLLHLISNAAAGSHARYEEIKYALDYVFNGTTKEGTNTVDVYSTIKARDGNANFETAINPTLKEWTDKFAPGAVINFVQRGKDGQADTIASKAWAGHTPDTTNNLLFGMDGNDTITGAGGKDYIYGGTGADSLHGGANNDVLMDADEGKGFVTGAGYADTLYGDAGNDTLVSRDGVDSLYGGANNDTLISLNPSSVAGGVLDGGAGNDTIWASGNTPAVGGAGSDVIYLNDAHYNTLPETPGAGDQDTLIAYSGPNTLNDGYYNAHGSFNGTLTNTKVVLNPGALLNIEYGAYTGCTLFVGNVQIKGTFTTNEVTDVTKLVDESWDIGNGWTLHYHNATATTAAFIEVYAEDAAPGVTIFNYDITKHDFGITIAATGAHGGPIFPQPTTLGASLPDFLKPYTPEPLYAIPGVVSLVGSAGDDVLIGGPGDHVYTGGGGTDSFKIALLNKPQSNTITDFQVAADAEGRFETIDVTDFSGGQSLALRQAGADAAEISGARNLVLRQVGTDTRIELDNSLFPAASQVITLKNVDAATLSANHFLGEGTLTVSKFVSAAPSSADDTIAGTAGNDTLHGLDGNDLIYGLGGNDQLYGDAGNDTLLGGDGNDTLYGGDGRDFLEGDDGLDTADFTGAIAWAIDLGAGTAHRSGDASSLTETLISIERLTLGSGNDTVTGSLVAETVDAGAGNDSVAAGGGNDSLIGGAGNDTLSGDDGNDTLAGGAGSNKLTGGTGVDRFVIGTDTVAASDTIVDFDAAGGEVIDLTALGSGLNLALVRGTGTTSFTVGNHTVTLTGVDASTLTLANFAGVASLSITVAPTSGDDSLTGTPGADTIDGLSGNDTISGLGGNDSLYGNYGDDVLIGGAGADTLNGGGGYDTASYAASAAGVTVNLGTGVGAGGDAAGDTLISIENLIGSANADSLTGNTSGNQIWGGGGNDTLLGDAGYDTIFGDDGNDSIDGGNDNDSLFGGAGNDFLAGSAGNDTLSGDDGNDTLAGGAGINRLTGGTGVDRFVIGTDTVAASDTIVDFDAAGGEVIDLTAFGAGLSLALVRGNGITSFTLGNHTVTLTGVDASTLTLANFAGVASLTYAPTNYDDNLTGTAGADTIDGLSGNDTISGLGGNDSLYGNYGDDVLIGGAGADTLNGGGGYDTASYATSAAAVTVNLGAATASGGDAAGDTFISIENLIGSANADSLTGNTSSNLILGGGGNDTILGDSGNDTLDGEAGNDSMDGGTGNDRLYGSAGADVMIGGTGTDTLDYSHSTAGVTVNLTTLSASGGYAAGDTISGAEYLVGSSYADSLTGDAGGNSLVGGLGNDTLHGEAGRDTIDGGDGNDSLYGGADNDRLTDALGANQLFGEAGNDTLTGGAGNDTLYGGTENDTLAGGAGNDSLSGDDGDDTLDGGAGADTIAGGNGIDTLTYNASTAAVNVSLKTGLGTVGDAAGDVISGIEKLIGSTYADTLTGSINADTIDGGRGNNVIDGDAGNDSIIGGSDSSTLLGGAGNDTLSGSYGNDSLRGGTENDSLYGGTGNDQLFGDAGNDTLNGSSGVDTLTGGTGADIYYFSTSDTGLGVFADHIADFNRAQGDKIDLRMSGIDASSFVGTGAFTAGGVKEFGYDQLTNGSAISTVIRIDYTNDGVTDREIVLDNIHIALQATDFLF